MSRIRTTLELPRHGVFPSTAKHYVPPSERDPRSIEAIRKLPADTKILLAELQGYVAMTESIKTVKSPVGLQFLMSRFASAAAVGTRLNFNKGIERSKNPKRYETGRNKIVAFDLFPEDNEEPLTPSEALDKVIAIGETCIDQSGEVIIEHIEGKTTSDSYFRKGQLQGKLVGGLAVLGASMHQRTGSRAQVSIGVRDDGLAAIEQVASDTIAYGNIPSPAFIGDPYGRFVPFMAESAPDSETFQGFMGAQEQAAAMTAQFLR